MAKILSIETSTTNCSVSISEGGVVLGLKEQNDNGYVHSELLHVFIDELLKERDWVIGDLDAVAVGKGPGSFTGLRIGVSAAKGLCYALDIPMIAIPSLENLAVQADLVKGEVVLPMLDARRMEVYTSVFDHHGQALADTTAEILDESFFDSFEQSRVVLMGDGAAKCADLIPDGRFEIIEAFPTAKVMGQLAWQRFQNKDFEDVAYFEPFYLKDFLVAKPKNPLR